MGQSKYGDKAKLPKVVFNITAKAVKPEIAEIPDKAVRPEKADKPDKPDKNAKGSKKIGNGFSYLNGFAVYYNELFVSA